jgi:hypothetical protein
VGSANQLHMASHPDGVLNLIEAAAKAPVAAQFYPATAMES